MLPYSSTLLKLFILNALMTVTIVNNSSILEVIQSSLPNFSEWYKSLTSPVTDIATAAQWPRKKTHTNAYSMESPTDVETTRAVPQILDPISVHLLFNMPHSAVSIINTGYYLEIKLQLTKDPKPFIIGGPLFNEPFLFEQAHLHWGRDDLRGSEHSINGKRHSVEVHVVWYNAKYGSFDDATKYPDGVAVVALFGQLSEHDNPDFNDLVEQISLITEPETETTGTFDEELKFLEILFEQQTYYSFPGSLTTPPFLKCVTWLMYCDEPFPISSRQISAFRELRNKDNTEMIRENDRPLQEFGRRPIITPVWNKKLEKFDDK